MRVVIAPLMVFAIACSEPSATSNTPSASDPNTEATGATSSLVELIAAGDARVLTDELRKAMTSSDVVRRRIATRTVARLHLTAAFPLLRIALSDPDPEVRRLGSLGIGSFEEDAPQEAERALLGALAAEHLPDNQAAMLSDLGRIGNDNSANAFRAALSSSSAFVREGACYGLGGYGLRRLAVDTTLMRRIAVRARDDDDPLVRVACSYALTRLPAPPPGHADHQAVIQDLVGALDDPEARVRVMAVRALSQYDTAPIEVFERRTQDADWQVSVQAFRALGKRRAESSLARMLRAQLDALGEAEPTGPTLHVLLTALDSLGPVARNSAVFGVSQEALDQLANSHGRPLSRDRGLAHCAAAKAVDLGRGWPSRVLTCGLEQVTDSERKVLAAEILGALEEGGSEEQRLVFLSRLYREGDARVRIAVLQAVPHVSSPRGSELVLGGLRDEDRGIVIAACDAVDALAERWRQVVAPAGFALVRPAGSPEPLTPVETLWGPPTRQVVSALRAAETRLAEADDLEGIQSWLSAVRAAQLPAFADRVAAYAVHHDIAVRRAARETAERLELRLSADGEVAPIPNPIEASALVDLPTRARLETSRGTIVLELFAEETPTTVARFVGLARESFFDGVSFHRVVPAFVAQGGDPRGDGYGGPGWSQRCEDSQIRYDRGTVGMALAGRDTGGSQFFIAHSAQPHLDGRYTAFGGVVEGLDVVDSLQPGDTITHIAIP